VIQPNRQTDGCTPWLLVAILLAIVVLILAVWQISADAAREAREREAREWVRDSNELMTDLND
jgi:hypothetical protein